jgi:LPXTG-site transpeptidase (sortase) family protein
MARYHYREGVTLDKKRGRWPLVVLSLLIIAAGLYVAAIFLAPQLVTIPFTRLTATATDSKIQNSKAGEYGNHLFLPQINVDVPVAIGGGSDALTLGAWQRNANLGDPAKNGNVVISAPRFIFAFTPQQARAESPFYNLNKIVTGDEVTLDYHGVRYVYKIDKKYTVVAGDTSMEQTSSDMRLTLYATDGNGASVAGSAVSGVMISPAKAPASPSN